jgi:NAD(P)-dependent dehydrogenase (short-subunit alcohol dehydrogenase family)
MKHPIDSFQSGSVALVTGGGSGLGRQLCIRLAGMGMTVVVTDLDQERAEQTSGIIRASGGRSEARRLDVRDREACEQCVQQVEITLGNIDLLVNNAGKVAIGDFDEVPLESWKGVMDTNFLGQLQTTKAVYPSMKARGKGCILFVSSIAGLALQPLTGSYCASKHALVGMASALYADARPNGIRVHVACPGYIGDTYIFSKADAFGYDAGKTSSVLEQKMKGFISPEKAAEKILQGIRRNRFFIVFPRNARLLWLLYRMAPGWAVRGSTLYKRIADVAKL